MTLDEYRLLTSTFAALASESFPRSSPGLRSLEAVIQRASQVSRTIDETEAADGARVCQHYATYTRLEAVSASFATPNSTEFRDALFRLQVDAANRIGVSIVTAFVRDCAERVAQLYESKGINDFAARARSDAEFIVREIKGCIASQRRAPPTVEPRCIPCDGSVDDLFQRLR